MDKVVKNCVIALPLFLSDLQVCFQLQNLLSKLPFLVRAAGHSLGAGFSLLLSPALESMSVLSSSRTVRVLGWRLHSHCESFLTESRFTQRQSKVAITD